MAPKTPGRITPAFGFQYVERSLHEGLARRAFGNEQHEIVFEELGKECVYCGSPKIERWDHLIAATQNGESVLGNFVPSCAPCDDSKGKRPFGEWMLSTAPKSPRSRGVKDVQERIQRLEAHQMRHNYVPVPLEERLTDDERVRLAAVREKLRSIRAEVESLIEDYQVRVEPSRPAGKNRKSSRKIDSPVA